MSAFGAYRIVLPVPGPLQYPLPCPCGHYGLDDAVSLLAPAVPGPAVALLNGLPFVSGLGAARDYYVVGTFAFLNDPTVLTTEPGWTMFTHGQPAAPAYLAAILAGLGLTWPDPTPAFKGKSWMFLATADCWVRFVGGSRVPQFIPGGTLAAGPYISDKREATMFFFEAVNKLGAATNEILYVWIRG